MRRPTSLLVATTLVFGALPACAMGGAAEYQMDTSYRGALTEGDGGGGYASPAPTRSRGRFAQAEAAPGAAQPAAAFGGVPSADPTADAAPLDEAVGPAGLAPTEVERLVIYTASFSVVVSDVERSRQDLLTAVADAGGFVESRSLGVLVLRVPSERFEELCERVRGAGRLLDEQVHSQDVTRQAYELDLRIDNAEKARERLIALLERGGELQHVLTLEAELRRVTEEIELLKSQRRSLSRDAAYSQVTVHLSSNAPDPIPVIARKVSAFPWVRDVGPEATLQMPMETDLFPALVPNRSIALPDSFVLLGRDLTEVRAVDAEGSRLWLRNRFVEGADLAFWKKAVQDELKGARGYAVLDVVERSGAAGDVVEVTCETRASGQPLRYLLLFTVRSAPVLGTWVETVELVADPASFDEQAARVREAYLGKADPAATQVATGEAP